MDDASWSVAGVARGQLCARRGRSRLVQRARDVVVMLHGFRGYRHQFSRHVDALRRDDRVLIVPHVAHGGNAPMSTVLDALAADLQALPPHLPVTWIGISNDARVALHAVAQRNVADGPRTQLILLAGPLRRTTRAALFPAGIARRVADAGLLAEMRVPAPLPSLPATTNCSHFAIHAVGVRYDYAIDPAASSTAEPHPCTVTHEFAHLGHTSMPQMTIAEQAALVDAWRE